jgi:hypothetical protein
MPVSTVCRMPKPSVFHVRSVWLMIVSSSLSRVLFVNRDELFSDQYKKYLGNQLRGAFGFEGCPVILVPRERPRTIEPVRKFKTTGPRRGGKRDDSPRRGNKHHPARQGRRKKR